MGTRRLLGTCVAALGLLLAGCAPGTPPPEPDPLVSCTGFDGSISYTPPAGVGGVDVTIDALAGSAFTGCTDGTGAGITGAALTASILFPAFRCTLTEDRGVAGTGTGALTWSDGSTSTASLSVLTRNGGYIVEFTLTGGRWSGARGSVWVGVTTSVGNCTPSSPVSSATVTARGPLVLHPAVAPLRPPLTDATVVSAGGTHTCAVVPGGAVNCWGSNSDGQLGNLLLAPGAISTVPVTVTAMSSAVSVSAGGAHTCALLSGGSVSCWGSNSSGQVGTAAPPAPNLPLPVAGLGPATQVSAGGTHTCALLVGGTVACWGNNDSGQLGNGTTTSSATPVPVAGITDATLVTAGGFHTCAVLSDGTARCWGSDEFGQLGDGAASPTPVTVPAPVPGLSGLVQVSAGGDHTCALNGAGSVFCWGFNRYGQLGLGPAGETPIPWPALIPYYAATSVSAGGAHTCATVAGGVVTCWGAGADGQVGDGHTVDRATPVPTFGIRTAGQVSAGGQHACALVSGGQVACWGGNLSGQLGDARTDRSTLPVPVVMDP